MIFNLNEFLFSISHLLDFMEMDLFGIVTNHSRRVAYISVRIARKLGLEKGEIFDLISLAMLHDNGASEKLLHDKLSCKEKMNLHCIESMQEHGIRGEENLKDYPFITGVHNVIKYHHENYDGSGFFGLKGEQIPLLARIIKLADSVDLNFHLKDMFIEDKQRVSAFVKLNENKRFSPELVEAFLDISRAPYFWLDLKDEYINSSIRRNMPGYSIEMPLSRVHDITKVFSRIIDAKSRFTRVHSSGLSEKVEIMGEFYRKPEDEIYKLKIAADLHDMGKLAVSNSVIDKPGKLDEREFDIIRQHPYYTRLSLQQISGFEDITEWASNHHEKLNGKGYPMGKRDSELDHNSRLMACLDIYEALMEERPYRVPARHEKAMEVLGEMAAEYMIDRDIVLAIDKVFGKTGHNKL